MLPGFEQVVRPYIPVVSHTKQKVVTPAQSPAPEVGIRWGKPSRFEFSNEKKKDKDKQPPTPAEIDHDITVVGDEVYRKWDRVKVYAKEPHADTSFEFERPKEMFFFIEEEERYEETINDNGNIQPEITTVYHYVRFNFTLDNPDEEIVGGGERGEHPDDTLAQTQAEYDNTVQGRHQKQKEYWEAVIEELYASMPSNN